VILPKKIMSDTTDPMVSTIKSSQTEYDKSTLSFFEPNCNAAENNDEANNEDRIQVNEENRLKRRQPLEAQVTVVGCDNGGGRKKQRIVDAFYDTLWPILEEAGWKLVSSC
jgi:hypothetical protein